MTDIIRLGISTCPNDTFAFHALLERRIDWDGLNLEIELLDIQQLNERLADRRLDVAKASFYAGLRLTETTTVLPCGSAIGFGVGPVLLSRRATSLRTIGQDSKTRRVEVLCPGQNTTATFLCESMLPFPVTLRQVVFSEIIPQLVDGDAILGACIHEGRFVWREKGLHLVADLGEIWERQTGRPLPLGGLLVRNDLPPDVMQRLARVVRASVEYARANPNETLETMRRYAQELGDEVLFAHVDLYVNDWTVDLGEAGRSALAAMHEIAVQKGLVHKGTPPFHVLQ